MKRLAVVIACAMVAATCLAYGRPSTLREGPHSNAVEGYDVFKDVESWSDKNYAYNYLDRFMMSRSPADTAQVKAGIDADIADQPARNTRVEMAWAADLIVLVLLMIIAAIRFFVRHAHSIKEGSLDAAGIGLSGARRIGSKIKDIGSEIDRRSK